MSNFNIRKYLDVRPVGMEHLDQFNELLRYSFQVTDKVLRNSGYVEGEIVRSKRPVLERSDVIGWFDGDRLVSHLSVYPLRVNIHGRIFDMAGMTGVGTYPEYSGLGLMNDLIKRALEHMREKEQWISFLYPFSIPYYRKKGWEIISDHLTYSIRDTQLPKFADIPGFVQRLPIDHADVIATYDRFSHENHGALIRERIDWQEYWRWENEKERIAAVYYDTESTPTGYAFYWIEDDIFHVKDMVYLNQQARRGLWNFIHAHYSMVDKVKGNIFRSDPLAFWLDDGHIIETIEPNYMARIVDVKAFIERYPFRHGGDPFHLVLTDPIAEWNRGVFRIAIDAGGAARVTHDETDKPVVLDIQTLSTLLMSYRRPSYLHEIERLSAHSDTLSFLESVIPDRQAYFSDYF